MKNKQLLLAVICSLMVPIAVGCSDNGSDNRSDSGADSLSEARAEGREIVRNLDACQEIADFTAQAACLERVQTEYLQNALR